MQSGSLWHCSSFQKSDCLFVLSFVRLSVRSLVRFFVSFVSVCFLVWLLPAGLLAGSFFACVCVCVFAANSPRITIRWQVFSEICDIEDPWIFKFNVFLLPGFLAFSFDPFLQPSESAHQSDRLIDVDCRMQAWQRDMPPEVLLELKVDVQVTASATGLGSGVAECARFWAKFHSSLWKIQRINWNQCSQCFCCKPSLSLSLFQGLPQWFLLRQHQGEETSLRAWAKIKMRFGCPEKSYESAALLHFSARPTSASLPWTPPVPLFQADCFIVSEAPVSVFACMCSQFLNQYVSGVLELWVAVCGPVDTWCPEAMPQPQTPYGPRVAGSRVAWVASSLTYRSCSWQMLGVCALTGSVPVAPPLHSAWPARQLHCSWATRACVYKLLQGHHPWCFPFMPERETIVIVRGVVK